ncbi:unnamed protein product [Blepharisma stoltei]|uniref:Phosphatidylinositol-4-phosphate 5-kinase n=1 Tax=Blepharisma stoltei TaxID=1481888 RepID=A0AAU9IB11_9CILI|nr:unnamed protein product [Blepharisma stoltei]
MRHRNRPEPLPTVSFNDKSFKNNDKGEEEDERLAYLEQLRTMSPISFKRKDPIMSEPAQILAIIPHNLGKIQKLTAYKNDLATIFRQENNQKSQFTESIIKPMKDFTEKSFHKEIETLENTLKEKKRSLSTKYPQSTHHYFKKNLGIFSPGIVRIFPKDGRPKTPTSVKMAQNDSKSPSPKKANLSKISTRLNISPLLKRTEEVRLTPMHRPKHIASPLSKSISIENGEELVKDESSQLRIECYKGDYSGGKRHGKGEIVYNNGDSYSGSWVNNKKEGKGRYFYNHIGAVYSGEWFNNKRHGQGKLKFKNGDRISGTWIEGRLSEDHTTIDYSDKAKYTGETKNGLRHGSGTIKYSCGFFYRGNWNNDIREGNGIIVFKREIFFEGTFHNDSTDGPGVLVRKDIINYEKINSYDDENDSPSVIFMSKDYDAYDRKAEFGNISVFLEFNQISLNSEDIVFIALLSEQLDKRLEIQHPHIESGNFKSGKLGGAGLAKYGIFGKYEGSFKEGCRAGWGRMTYSDPEHICSWFNETEGNYVGEWKDDFRHGSGVMTWPNGMKYEGRYIRDHRNHVTGKMTFQNGEIYDGGWVDDKMEGACTFKKQNGVIFKGQFSRGLPSDMGVLEFPDGARYEGKIEKWVPHGIGKMRSANGDIYEGDFEEGKINGVGTMIYANGDIYSGEWENGKKNGKGHMKYSKNGETYEGEWINDYREGKGVLKDADGDVIFLGQWANDKKEGRGSIAHTPSGKLALGYL